MTLQAMFLSDLAFLYFWGGYCGYYGSLGLSGIFLIAIAIIEFLVPGYF